MKSISIGRVVLCALMLPFASYATSYYLVTTGQATANTQLDDLHDRTWSFAPLWDWSLGGGSFTIKRGPSTTLDAVLTLYVGGPTGTVVTSVAVSPTVVPTAYAPVAFLFSAPVTLQAGNNYALVLTSDTGDNGSQQYFIKGQDNNFNDFAFQDGNGGALPTTDPSGGGAGGEVVPEPGMMAAAGGAIVLAAVWRRRRAARAAV